MIHLIILNDNWLFCQEIDEYHNKIEGLALAAIYGIIPEAVELQSINYTSLNLNQYLGGNSDGAFSNVYRQHNLLCGNFHFIDFTRTVLSNRITLHK